MRLLALAILLMTANSVVADSEVQYEKFNDGIRNVHNDRMRDATRSEHKSKREYLIYRGGQSEGTERTDRRNIGSIKLDRQQLKEYRQRGKFDSKRHRSGSKGQKLQHRPNSKQHREFRRDNQGTCGRCGERADKNRRGIRRPSAAVGQIENLEDLVREYEQSDREVRKQALENMHSYITLFFVIGFGMLIGGAFLTFWVSGKLGGIILGIGVLTVGFAAASQYYLEEIAIVGLIVLIVGFFATLGVVGWMLIDGRNDKQAVKEIVQLVEAMKDRLNSEERREVFGQNGIASKLTHDNTKKIIAQIKIKNGWHKH